MVVIVHLFIICHVSYFLTGQATESDVYLSLNSNNIPNFGYVMISDIGSGNDGALICNTDRPKLTGKPNSGGDWFAPDGTRVDGTDVPGFMRNRDEKLVRLLRTTGTPNEGLYYCVVENASMIPQTVYVVLVNDENGKLLETLYV